MKTVIVTPDLIGPIQNGGIGTFATNFALLLRHHGHEVSVLFTAPDGIPRRKWMKLYQDQGIDVIHVKERPLYANADGDWWFIRRGEAVTQCLPSDTDVVYFQDWQGNGFHTVRNRRFAPAKYPIFVSILHSNSDWVRQGAQQFSENLMEDMSLSFAERYTVQYSDFVVSPTQYMLNWVRQHNWKLPSDERTCVLGLPLFRDTIHQRLSQNLSTSFKRIVFFGRLETRKGLELFVDGLLFLKQKRRSSHLGSLESVVLLGKQGLTRYASISDVVSELEQELEVPVTVMDSCDSYQAQTYLAEIAVDSLIVTPSLVDNMPYAVTESSTIPDLNIISSANGGMPEILGPKGKDQLFEPYVPAFAEKLDEWLAHGPRQASDLSHYDIKKHNAAWLEFHESVCEFARSVKRSPSVTLRSPQSTKSIAICVPYFNHGKYLPQLLTALEYQTSQVFDVVVVNDGSTDTFSNIVFNEMAAKYQEHGWQFISNPNNQGVSVTRNIAAKHSHTDYLIFVDADNVPAPQMVQQFGKAIQNSDADCLTCYLYGFEGEGFPYQTEHYNDGRFKAVKKVKSPLYLYMPLGNVPELGMWANVFGDANLIIKRRVFEAIGGFSSEEKHRYLGYEDYELLVRLSLAGYELDVIPEFLFYYRHLSDSLMRRTNRFGNIMRVQDVYRQHLGRIGLAHLAPVFNGDFSRDHQLAPIDYTDPHWLATRVPWFKIRDALVLKARKHLKRIPLLGKYFA